MPGGDGTGPMGYGPRSGRGAGYCVGYGMPGYANAWPRRHWRRFGYAGPACYPAAPYVDEKVYLQQEAEGLKEELSMLEARIKELEAMGKKEE